MTANTVTELATAGTLPLPAVVQLPRCICPDPTLHTELGDAITLADTPDLRQTLIANKSIRFLKSENPKATVAEVLAVLTEVYVRHFVVAWSLLRRDGKKLVPLELTPDNLDRYLASDVECAMLVADAADDRFNSVILDPLVRAASTSSQASPTDESTSRQKLNGARPSRSPSKHYSTTSSPTAGTVPTA